MRLTPSSREYVLKPRAVKKEAGDTSGRKMASKLDTTWLARLGESCDDHDLVLDS